MRRTNTGLICDKHAEARHAEFQNALGDKIVPTGGFVKLKFTEGEISEHMWVLITLSDQTNFEGLVSNDPLTLVNVKCGDSVKFTRTQIEAIY